MGNGHTCTRTHALARRWPGPPLSAGWCVHSSGTCAAQAGLIAPELASGQDPWWGLVSPLSPFPQKKSHRTPLGHGEA